MSKAKSRGKRARRSPEALEVLTSKLVTYVKANPGQGIEQIALGIGRASKVLTLPMRKLVAKKTLKTKGQKRGTKYFAT